LAHCDGLKWPTLGAKPSTLFWAEPRTEEAVDWRAKAELFEKIRREYEVGVGTIQGVARKFGVHRRTVREALANALPAHRKKPQRKRPRLAAALPFIEAILEEDRRPPRMRRAAWKGRQDISAATTGCRSRRRATCRT